MPQFEKSFRLFDYNLGFLRRLADFSGCDMMAENYKFNYRTATCISLLILGFIGSMYSIIDYYPDYCKMCETFFVLCFALQGLPRFYFGYVDREFYRVQYERLRELHYKYRSHDKINASFLLLMERIHLITKLILVLYICGGFIYFLYPIYMYWAHAEKVLIIAFQLPGVDSDSTFGYVITNSIHALMLFLGMTGYATSDAVILLFVANLAAYVSVFTNDLDELNKELNEDPLNESQIKKRVRSICIQHQDIIQYESDLDERYIVICFVQVLSCVAAMSAILLLVYTANFLPGYAILVILFSQLTLVCLLGTILTVKNEEISNAIYHSQWYLLEKPEQKCFLLMLQKSQHFVEMTVGGFAPLNMETFVAIMNRIYSYFTMLITFVE